MIALFDEPPRVSLNAPHVHSRVGLLMGMVYDDGRLSGVVVCDDGEITEVNVEHMRVDYRYDPETDRWIDTNAPGPDQE
jgi:hypothetical protein